MNHSKIKNILKDEDIGLNQLSNEQKRQLLKDTWLFLPGYKERLRKKVSDILSYRQRENLLERNEDLFAGVYELQPSDCQDTIVLRLYPNILACYENKIINGEIQVLSDNRHISILSLNKLQKGEISVLSGPNIDIPLPVLLSNGVIDYITATNKDGEERQHIITTTRDGAGADAYKITTTAGRNTGYNLKEELRREQIEESPFLGKNHNGNYVLCTIDNSETGKKILKASIKRFLNTKYNLDPSTKEDAEKIRIFERSFPGVQYSQLGTILEDILKDDSRILSYDVSPGSLPGIQPKGLKVISDYGEDDATQNHSSQGKYYIYEDPNNNTIEYREIQEIKNFPDDFVPLSKKPSRLFLESRIQRPIAKRIQNLKSGTVPTLEEISRQVKNALSLRNHPEQFAEMILQNLESFPQEPTGRDQDARDFIDTFFSGEKFGLTGEPIHHMKIKFPGTRNEYYEDDPFIFESDSCVYNFGDKILKIYYFLGKTDIEKYHGIQNKLANQKYEDILFSGKYKDEEFSSVSFSVLRLPQEVYGNEKHAVTYVPKQIGEPLQNDYNNILEEITKQINEKGQLKLETIHMMNSRVTGVKDGTLQVVITDIANTIKRDVL